MPPVFLDTAGLLALVNRDDALHRRAGAVLEELAAERQRALTTDWVLAEFLGSAARSRLRRPAARLVAELVGNPDVLVLPATRRSWSAAFILYQRRHDKEWSLVDCASILACESRGVRRVFTHDHHFAQAGFEAILRGR